MLFDLDLIRKVYAEMPARIAAARKLIGKPLTLTEKILYGHLYGSHPEKPFVRGKDYVDFAPDRVAMQDGIVTV
jgi:aconitate hydratase